MMVLYAIRQSLHQEKKNYFVIILWMIFTFLCGTNIHMAKAAGLSAGEFVLLSITDHYYLIYGFFFYAIFWIFRDVKEDNDLELLRYESYDKYYFIRCASAFIRIMIFIVIHIVIAGILGVLFLDGSIEFMGHEIVNYYNSSLEFVLVFQNYFENTVTAILAVSSVLLLGIFFIYEILFYIHKTKGNKAEILAMVSILVNVIVGFKSQIDESVLEVLFLNNYFILHHSLFLVGKMAVWINLFVMILVSVWLNRLAVKMKRKGKWREKKERPII